MIKETCGRCKGVFEVALPGMVRSTEAQDERAAVVNWRNDHRCAIGVSTDVEERYTLTCEILWPNGSAKTPFATHAEMPDAVRWLIEQLAAYRELLEGAEARVRQLEDIEHSTKEGLVELTDLRARLARFGTFLSDHFSRTEMAGAPGSHCLDIAMHLLARTLP